MGRGGRGPGGERFTFRVSRSMRNFESSVATNDRESAAVFDAQGNQLGEVISGDRLSVDIGPAIDAGVLPNAVLTHNHPGNNGIPPDLNAFSMQDLMIASQYNMRAIRAVTATREFTMERPAGGWPPPGLVRANYNAISRATADESRDRIIRGEPLQQVVADRNNSVPIAFSRAIADRYGARFTERPRRR